MRTTTKRGLGRSASTNGNGRAVLPPLVELATITRYRQPQPPRRTALAVAGHALLWLLAALAVVGTGLAGGAYLYYHETLSDITASTPEVKLAAKQLNVALPGEPAVALAIGYDKRAGVERGFEARSDTIMLVRADPRTKAVTMLSFPRDLVVEIHCPGRLTRLARINEAYTDCGTRGVLETVRRLTGLPINYLVTVNFRGFKQMVAKLGGVWIDVDRRYFNDNSGGGERYATIDLQPGYQKLNGSDALDYVRYRHFDSDLYRLARQQFFVQAFKQAITSSFSPTDTSLLKITGVIRKNVQVGAGGGGTVSGKTLLRYALLAYDLPPGHFFQTKIEFGCYQGQFELTVPESCIRDAVAEFANPDVDAPEKATAAALGRKPKPSTAPPPSATSLVVLNGNGVAGAAADTAYLLGKHGYVVLRSGDAPRQDYFNSVVYYDDAQPRARQAARRLQKVFGDADVEPVTPRIRQFAGGAMLVAVLGQTFHGTIGAAPVDRTPKRQPPQVAPEPGAADDLLRPLRRKVPFRLLAPTVLERTSALTSTTPVRLYRIAGHPTIRLTYVTGASEYWGIQMVKWNGAPALKAPNDVLRVKKRRFELHFTGSKLHMVVLRERGATYWVVNTVVNSLSNETMLAIAKGLKPLPRR